VAVSLRTPAESRANRGASAQLFRDNRIPRWSGSTNLYEIVQNSDK
jgi:hypothetical protein